MYISSFHYAPDDVAAIYFAPPLVAFDTAPLLALHSYSSHPQIHVSYLASIT